MSRRSRYSLTKISADLPEQLVQELDSWKEQVDGLNRSRLIGDLLTWALARGAIDELYPDCALDHDHRESRIDCDCACPACHAPSASGAG